MHERFISQPIQPVGEPVDLARMAIGEPGVPSRFTWGDQTIGLKAVLRTWKQTGRCKHGSPEMYVRKHWFEIATDDGRIMKIYFDRQPRQRSGWWLFSFQPNPDNADKYSFSEPYTPE